MLTKPKHGWTNVQIEDFVDRASYLTDIPNDCLDAFIYGIENNMPVVIYFDAEGWDYHLVASYYESYIIREKESLEIYKFKKNYIDLAYELIKDIEDNINEWTNWLSYSDYTHDELLWNKTELQNKLTKLKQVLDEFEYQ